MAWGFYSIIMKTMVDVEYCIHIKGFVKKGGMWLLI